MFHLCVKKDLLDTCKPHPICIILQKALFSYCLGCMLQDIGEAWWLDIQIHEEQAAPFIK